MIGEQDEQSTDSVYDFLYHDAQRVASFLSQFDNSGHLTQVVQGTGIHRTKSDTGVASVKGSALAVSGEGTYTTTAADEHRKDSQRVYDPLWANALTLLDYLSERDMIVRDITKAKIGQFALASGSLQVTDLGIVRKMLDLQTMRTAIGQGLQPAPTGNRHQRRAGKAPAAPPPMTDMTIGIEVLAIMPHSVQATVTGGEVKTWCTLKSECLTVQSSDLLLKHGVAIPGEWHVLGIADASPDDELEETPSSDDVAAGIVQSGFGAVVSALVPLTRMLLGRPQQCYGITPLMIFRVAS